MASRVIFMCGPSGSGKSTVARELEHGGMVRLSFDAEMWRLGIRATPLAPDVRARIETDLRSRLFLLLEDGRDVVLDYSFWSREMRDEYRALLRTRGIEPEVIYLDTPREVALERVARRAGEHPDDLTLTPELAAEHFDHFEAPSRAEGPLQIIRSTSLGQPGPIDGILLDFHNTLAIPVPLEAWIADARTIVDETAPDYGALHARLPRVWTDARRQFPTRDWDLDPREHRAVFISALAGDGVVSVELAAALYETMPQQAILNTGAREFLERAVARGIRLALVSNTALDLRPMLHAWGVLHLLDAVILSFEVGVTKPDPRIFHLAASALLVDPSRCVMIGDSERDDGGAAAIGIRCHIATPDQMHATFETVCPVG